MEGETLCRLVEALAGRMCGWCSGECIREGLGGRGRCAHIVRDAYLAVIAQYSWRPLPGLDEPPGRVLEWAARSLYLSSVAPLLASRRYSRLVGSRGLFSRRLVERLLHDYWLLTGYRIVASDRRLPGGWVAHASLVGCPGGGAETLVEEAGGLGLRVEYRCGGETLASVELAPPEGPRCRG